MVSKEKLEFIKDKLKKKRENRKECVIDYFNNLKPFNSEDDIPDIPITDGINYI